MTTPVLAPESTVDIPENAVAIRLPVMVVEGLSTSDGRYIEPGALSTRALPIPLYAQTRATHGDQGDAATWLVGSITRAGRLPGPEVTQLSTGEPFPEGTFVWWGEGWMYTDVPAAPEKSAYQLVKDRALRGNSVDLSGVEAELVFPESYQGADPSHAEQIVMVSGDVAATTLVGQPAFADAYIELDGQAMVAAGFEPGTDPAWRSADVGDVCSPCQAVNDDEDGTLFASVEPEILQGADFDPPDVEAPRHTGGMIALVPQNPAMLVVPDGDPADDLHLTLAYLGDDVTEWPEELTAAIVQVTRKLAGQDSEGDDPDAPQSPGPLGPLTGNVFAHAVFNPNGDNGHDPAAVYLLDGAADRQDIDLLASMARSSAQHVLGDVYFPEQYDPYVPHVTAGYRLDPGMLTYTGPVVFDRVRLALGDTVVDYRFPGAEEGALVASVVRDLPPVDWFTDPQLSEPTAPTVTEDGRAFGHLALWDTCHIGFTGRCVTPPRSFSNYAYFLVHSTRARDENGDVVTVPVGYGTIGTGHADIRSSAMAAAEHYDNTGTVAFEYNVGEDAHGIWFAGRMLPGLSREQELKARGVAFSGDWRAIRGNLELVASLGVNTPGFPVPRVRVASGAPVALVAGGVATPNPAGPPSPEDHAQTATPLPADVARFVAWAGVQIRDQRLAAITAATTDASHVAALAALARVMLTTDEDITFLAALDREALARLHLPSYIKRIAKHLQRKGMGESQAIATAVNAAKKMCSTGDLNFPGSQDVNPGSRAEACEAVAQWRKDRPGAS